MGGQFSGVDGSAIGPGALERLREAALDILSPPRCAGCERPGALVCERCLSELDLIDPRHCCTGCAAPHGDIICTECRARVAPRNRWLAVASFTGPAPRIVRAYKDGGERALARPIAEMLLDAAVHAERVAPDRYGGLLSSAQAVAFVPATARAYRRRGFDHMEAIAHELASLSGVPVADVLVKHGSADQRGLTRRQRGERAAGAYEVLRPLSGARLLLLDDVITTGSTLTAASSALERAGAGAVDALAFARVW